MIAICCATTDEVAFRASGGPTIEALDERSSLLLRRHGADSVDTPYNEMLEVVARSDDLEAVVLVHQDAVVDRDTDVLGWVRALLGANPDVAAIGTTAEGPAREVAAIDGTLLALSPWAARNLSFDSAVGASADASAADFSLRARATGRRVLAAPLGIGRRSPVYLDSGARGRELRALLKLRERMEAHA